MTTRLRDLSLRFKIPLRATALVFLTATLLTVSLLAREYTEMRHEMLEGAARWSGVLGRTLVSPMLHDDLWRSYEIIRAATGGADTPDLATAITLVDAQRRVFVSTDPDRYPVMSPLHEAGAAGKEIDALLQGPGAVSRTLETGAQRLFLLAPIEADGVLLGHLLLEYSTSIFVTRFTGMWASATVVTLLVLVLILPLSAYWGRRLADPLVTLAECMGKIGGELPAGEECRLLVSKDEVGQLGAALKRLIAELREKQELERQMLFSERLAAVGRLAGGIAHEINNPLGGMLNAINTYQRHGVGDPELTARTISLLERGLKQIRDTVSALLVEAKAPTHPLSVQDFDDVRTLVAPQAAEKDVHLDWQCALDGDLPLSSTLLRQVLLNLLLNALKAVERGGRVACSIALVDGRLEIRVDNDGQHIEAAKLPYIFEPFVLRGNGGHGLGLWITYQIVHELEGEISVHSDAAGTSFITRFPLPELQREEVA